MRRSQPVEVAIPDNGVAVFESIHDTAFDMPPRVDPFDKLILVVRGRIQIEGPAGDAEASFGSVVYVPSGVSHRVKDLWQSTLFLMRIARGFEVDRPDVRDLIASLGDQISVWDRLPFRETLVPLWRRLISEQTAGNTGSGVVIRSEVQQLIVRLARSLGPIDGRDAGRIHLLLEEMKLTSYEPWSVDRAAEWVGVSRRQLTKLFRSEWACSFVEMLTRLRLDRAKAFLLSGGYTAAGAAYASGFGDIAHFYRVFKKHEGKTPREWLTEHLRADP